MLAILYNQCTIYENMFDAVRILMWVLESGRIPNHGSIKYNQIGFLAMSNASGGSIST